MTDFSKPWQPGTDPAVWLRAAIDQGLVRAVVIPAIEEVIGEVNELLERLADNTLLVERTRLRDKVAQLEAENEQLRFSKTALTQTINAYPDAVANSAANLAHARAQRDEMSKRVTELRGEVKELYAKLASHENGCEHEAWESKHFAELTLVKAERDQARAQVADYENRITWDTTCGQCANLLDRSIADYERIRELEAERDAGVLEYLRTHPDETRRIIERERQRLAAPPDIVRRSMGEEFQP